MLWCFGQTVGAHSMPPVHCARELSRTNQEPHPRELWLLGWCVFCAPGTGKLLGSSLCPRCFFFLGENALLFAFGLSPLSRASLQIVRGGHFICGYNVASIPTVRDVPSATNPIRFGGHFDGSTTAAEEVCPQIWQRLGPATCPDLRLRSPLLVRSQLLRPSA